MKREPKFRTERAWLHHAPFFYFGLGLVTVVLVVNSRVAPIDSTHFGGALLALLGWMAFTTGLFEWARCKVLAYQGDTKAAIAELGREQIKNRELTDSNEWLRARLSQGEGGERSWTIPSPTTQQEGGSPVNDDGLWRGPFSDGNGGSTSTARGRQAGQGAEAPRFQRAP